MNEEMKAYFSPIPKFSMGCKNRKTIHYLQKCKDEGKKIVQHCPGMLSPIFIMAASLADVDVCRLAATDGGTTTEDNLKNASFRIGSFRQMAPFIHINYVTETNAFYNKEEALKNFADFHTATADSILPMGINNETLKFVADNHCIIYGHAGALSGWQTNGLYGGYRKQGKTAEDAMKVFMTAYEYQENGMKAISIELTPGEVTSTIAKKLRIPVLGIACGCTGGDVTIDGYEMVDADLFGLMAKPAMHAKTYGNLLEFATGVYAGWVNDVRNGTYPTENNGWHMDPAELEKFNAMTENF